MEVNRPRIIEYVWLVVMALLAVWLRSPAFGTNGFHNEDAAGITYNADLLLHGFLPLVDNFEVKAPGSFYVVAAVWSFFGRSMEALQVFMCFWSILAAIGVYVGARVLYGSRSGMIASLGYVVLAPITDSIDINYGAWMIPAYVWATTFFVLALKTDRGRWWLATGFMLALAGVLKRQAAVLFPLFTGVLVFQHKLVRPEHWPSPGSTRKSLLLFFSGLALGFAPILLWYASQGALLAFIETYFFSSSGWKYAQSSLTWAEKLPRLGDGLMGFFEYLALPTLLALAAAFNGLRSDRAFTVRGAFLGGLILCGFAGAAIGYRFFKGYYLQVLPAILFLAAHPNGPISKWASRGFWAGSPWGRRILIGGAIALLLAPVAINDSNHLSSIRKQRETPRDLRVQKIAKYIAEQTQPDDRIWIWGRWAWPIYFHADRLSSTRFYKSLAIFTNNLTNTWRRPTRKTEFDPRSPWQDLMAELEAEPPAFIVLAHNESYRSFTALNDFIKRRYVTSPKPRVRGFSIYRLRQ